MKYLYLIFYPFDAVIFNYKLKEIEDSILKIKQLTNGDIIIEAIGSPLYSPIHIYSFPSFHNKFYVNEKRNFLCSL